MVEGILNEGFIVPDEELFYDFNFGRIYLDVSNQSLTKFEVDTDDTHLVMHDSLEYINFKMKNSTLNFVMDYDLYTVPYWVEDRGQGQVNITEFAINMDVKPN